MPPVLLPLFLLPQVKPAGLFRIPLCAGNQPPFLFLLLPLEREGLLGFGANSGILKLFLNLPLHPFGVSAACPQAHLRNRRAKPQPAPVAEHKGVDLIVLWLGPECDLARLKPGIGEAFVNAHPERAFEKKR